MPALLKDSKMAQGTIDSAAACAHEQRAACVRLGDFLGMEDSRVSFGPKLEIQVTGGISALEQYKMPRCRN